MIQMKSREVNQDFLDEDMNDERKNPEDFEKRLIK